MTEEIETMYQTSGELDEALMVKMTLYSYMLPKKQRRVYVLCGILIVESLLLLYMGSEYALLFLILTMVLTALFIYLPFVLKKSAKARFRESAPSGTLAYTTSFSESKLHLVNHTNGGSVEVELTQFKRLMQVDDVWALISKGSMIYPVFAAQLSETDRGSVLDLLKANNPKVKIELSKKK